MNYSDEEVKSIRKIINWINSAKKIKKNMNY